MNVRAFYGEFAYEAVRKAEAEAREARRILAQRLPELVDDVYSQVTA